MNCCVCCDTAKYQNDCSTLVIIYYFYFLLRRHTTIDSYFSGFFTLFLVAFFDLFFFVFIYCFFILHLVSFFPYPILAVHQKYRRYNEEEQEKTWKVPIIITHTQTHAHMYVCIYIYIKRIHPDCISLSLRSYTHSIRTYNTCTRGGALSEEKHLVQRHCCEFLHYVRPGYYLHTKHTPSRRYTSVRNERESANYVPSSVPPPSTIPATAAVISV